MKRVSFVHSGGTLSTRNADLQELSRAAWCKAQVDLPHTAHNQREIERELAAAVARDFAEACADEGVIDHVEMVHCEVHGIVGGLRACSVVVKTGAGT
jgi:hypothetical protein